MAEAFVVDSWAWIEYFEGSRAGEAVKRHVEEAHAAVYTSAVSLAEVVSKFLRKRMDPHLAVSGISALSVILPADQETAALAGELHAEIKASVKDFGLADAFVLAAARKKNAKILTGDPHFRGFEETVFLA